MPKLRAPRPRRPGRPSRRARPGPARIVVLGDLMLDVVLAPARALERGTDVPGRVSLVQGGSAANTARWLGRLGARTTLVAAVGRDAAGRALVDAVRADGVQVARRARGRCADRADRGPRLAGWRALLRRRPRRRRPARDPTTCRPPGSRGPMPCTCRSTRSWASRWARRPSGRGAGARVLARSSASTWPRSARCSEPAVEPPDAHRGGRAGPALRDRRRSRGPARRRRRSTACSTSRRPRS